MNSSGFMTIWVVPSLNAPLQLQHEVAGATTLEPFVGDSRSGDVAAGLLQFCTLIGAPAHRRSSSKPWATTCSTALARALAPAPDALDHARSGRVSECAA
jgi:hypothetical protein